MCGLSRRNIAGVLVNIIALLLGMIGLGINELTVFLNDSDEVYKYCGWQQIFCYNDEYDSNEDSDSYCTAVVSEIEYSDDCKNCDSSCLNSDYYDFDQDDYCKTEGSGDVWLACGILAIIFLIIALLLVVMRIWVDTENKCNGHYNIIPAIICTFGALFYIIGVVAWFVDNPVCWDSKQLNNREIDFGASPYLLLAAAVVSMAAAPLAMNQK